MIGLAVVGMIIGVAVAAFVGSLAGIYCGLRIAMPAIKALMEEDLKGGKP